MSKYYMVRHSRKQVQLHLVLRKDYRDLIGWTATRRIESLCGVSYTVRPVVSRDIPHHVYLCPTCRALSGETREKSFAETLAEHYLTQKGEA